MAFAEKMILAVFGMLLALWMTRRITDDTPGWGALFHGRAGDGTASVSSILSLRTITELQFFMFTRD